MAARHAAVSRLAGVYANLDPHETAWKQNMDALNYFLKDRNCDQLLSRRVRPPPPPAVRPRPPVGEGGE